MNAVYWAWGAVLADMGIFLSPLVVINSMPAFIAVLIMHSVACGVVGASTYLLLPSRYKQPREMVFLLMFSFAFIAPVIGAMGMLFITRSTLREDADNSRFAIPVSIELPEYDVQSNDAHRGGRGAIRSRLETNVPSEVRMQSLLTLQAVSNRVSNPILEDLLGDSTDDVRLVAFGMLDAEEKKLSVHIQREQDALLRELSPEQRYACCRYLAELHWELIYTSLAQGALRQHMLNQARKYFEAALATGIPPDSGLVFLEGRILLNQGDMVAAERAIQQSVALGQPLTSALPYLAEIAFKNRNYPLVKIHIEKLKSLNLASKTRAIEDFWTERENDLNFNDYRYLPHI
jgi:polysaccharide biosynthesis protein PelE